ncbi:MAG: DoxX family protein [Candidatus Rokubacteria bacterium]|nr:DoxX family protein [Candidatus Rokubacteria bacterium]
MKEFGATILRVLLGVIYVMHAYLSLVVFTPAGVASLMGKTMGLPAPLLMAWLLILVHALGGVMLILGLWTRWAAAANALLMLGALVKVHLHQGFFMKAVIADAAAGRADVAGYEYVLVLLGATVAQVFLGSGAWALTRFR